MITLRNYIRYLKASIRTIYKPSSVYDTPIHIQLEPTNICNLKCIMCNRDLIVKNPGNMNLERFKKIIDTINPYKLTLSGLGEPLMNKELPAMIKYSKCKHIDVNTTSNLTISNKSLLESTIKSGLDLLSISLDASNSSTYFKIRGVNEFNNIIENILYIQSIKNKLGIVKPFLRLCFVIQKENIWEMVDFLKLSQELNIKYVYFQILELTGVTDRKEALVGAITFDTLKKNICEAIKYSHQNNINANLDIINSRIEQYWNKYKMNFKRYKTCILPWFSTYITVEGCLFPCCSFALSPIKIGNIFEEELFSVWNGKQYKDFRKLIKHGNKPYKICQNCVPENLLDIFSRVKYSPSFLNKYFM